MRRKLMTIILWDMWANIKKKKRELFSTVILSVICWMFVVPMFFMMIGVTGKEAIYQFLWNPDERFQYLAVFLIGYVLIVVVVLLKKIPMRICRGIYICPAGEKEKLQYAYLQIALKMIVGFGLFLALTYACIGGIFFTDNLFVNSIEVLLIFCSLLNVNLYVGIGVEGAKEIDAEGYRIESAAEKMLNVYGAALLVLEWIVFWLYPVKWFDTHFGITLVMWIVFLLADALFLIKYTKPRLQEMISYEYVYCPKPKRED